MAKKELNIPYDKNGDMIQWDHDYQIAGRRDNSIWNDVLRYGGCGRGRSAAYFIWHSIFTNRRYYMFMSDMNDILLTTDIVDKEIKGQFTYVKKGQNFGIQKVGEFPSPFERAAWGEIEK